MLSYLHPGVPIAPPCGGGLGWIQDQPICTEDGDPIHRSTFLISVLNGPLSAHSLLLSLSPFHSLFFAVLDPLSFIYPARAHPARSRLPLPPSLSFSLSLRYIQSLGIR